MLTTITAPRSDSTVRGLTFLVRRTADPIHLCPRHHADSAHLITSVPRSPRIISSCGPATARVGSTTTEPHPEVRRIRRLYRFFCGSFSNASRVTASTPGAPRLAIGLPYFPLRNDNGLPDDLSSSMRLRPKATLPVDRSNTTTYDPAPWHHQLRHLNSGPQSTGTAHRLSNPHLTHHVRLFGIAHHDGVQPTVGRGRPESPQVRYRRCRSSRRQVSEIACAGLRPAPVWP